MSTDSKRRQAVDSSTDDEDNVAPYYEDSYHHASAMLALKMGANTSGSSDSPERKEEVRTLIILAPLCLPESPSVVFLKAPLCLFESPFVSS